MSHNSYFITTICFKYSLRIVSILSSIIVYEIYSKAKQLKTLLLLINCSKHIKTKTFKKNKNPWVLFSSIAFLTITNRSRNGDK
jgi:hypothetical protein